MRIGLDIDNVITDYDKTVKTEFMLEDKNKRNTGIIHPKVHMADGMFDWSDAEIEDFCVKNMERMAAKLAPRRNCKKIMDKLLADGHELYLISYRANPHYQDAGKITTDWLKKHHINYSKLILSNSPNKAQECKNLKIDIMIDDRVDKCILMREQGVNCWVMQTRYNLYQHHNLPIIKSWNHLYQVIKQL